MEVILNKIKCFNSDKQYYHKWIKDKLIDSILRVLYEQYLIHYHNGNLFFRSIWGMSFHVV